MRQKLRPQVSALARIAPFALARRGRLTTLAYASVGAACSWVTLSGCQKSSAVSAANAKVHVAFLSKASTADVEEIRAGLPKGAVLMASVFAPGKKPTEDPASAREALNSARNKVQDLRVAKSTFFAVTDATGLVLRNDQEQDAMAGKNLFQAYPALKSALGAYTETRGSLPEAAGVRGRPDAQWVAGTPIQVSGEAKGVYVTGWSWSAYAYRLENQLRSEARSEAGDKGKLPLVYVFVMVEKDVYGAPISPEVNAKAVRDNAPWSKLTGDAPLTLELEIEGRDFGLAVGRVPALGKDVALAVLRSET